MNYRTLGRTDLSVSQIGYGAEHLTDADYATTKAVIDCATDAGINIVDVFMPQPQVRENIGKALEGKRKDVILQGHIGATMQGDQYKRSRDPKACDEFVNDFLKRFKTDYIDLGMIHFVDTKEDFDKAFNSPYIEYVKELKKNGKIRFIGASSHSAPISKKMVETGIIDMLMFSINPAFDILPASVDIDALFDDKTYDQNRFEIDPERAELYRLCQEKNIGITNMKTLGGGRLLNAKASPFGVALTPAQCIHYALERPGVASVLMGARSVDELKQCLKYETASAKDKDYTIIANGVKSAPTGKCMYCNHCLPCPVSIDIAAVTKYLDIARLAGDVPPTIMAHYKALSTHAGDCTQCGNCEGNCPFKVSIRENMKKAAKLFGC